MKQYLSILSLILVLFSACNEVHPKGEKDVRAFVKQWNENHTQLKAPYLERDYMDVVDYYGKEQTKLDVRQDKLVLFEQFPDYKQEIIDDKLDIVKEGGTYLIVFNKRVKYSDIEAEYESYLTVILKNGGYRILREGVADNLENQDAVIFPKYREINIAKTRNRQLFGDFNGDGLSDYAYVDGPVLLTTPDKFMKGKTDKMCEGECTSVINFSAPETNAITIKNAYKSALENLQDLNGDGADEVGFWNIKPSTKSLYVFDAVTSKLLTPPITINTAKHKNLKLIDVIKKTGVNKITVTRSEQVNGKWVLLSDVVEVE